MHADIGRILISREQIDRRVGELAGEIGRLYADSEKGLFIVCVLSGAIIFVSDLIRQLPMKMRVGLLAVSSYPGKTTQAQPAHVLQSFDLDVTGLDVLVIDDILDTGGTLRVVMDRLAAMRPASLRSCVLLRKSGKARGGLEADLVGFDIEDVFVVGYGLDYDGLYRNLPVIAVLKPELYG